jgi:LPXTG-motif cell wall-anchored protein
LEPGSYWEVVVRSTPVVIASGFVLPNGTYSATAFLPAGLEAGVHTMIWEGIGADGSPLVSTVYFAVGPAGELLYKSDVIFGDNSLAIMEALQAAEGAIADHSAEMDITAATLARTGANQSQTAASLAGAAALLILGFSVIALRKSRRRVG